MPVKCKSTCWYKRIKIWSEIYISVKNKWPYLNHKDLIIVHQKLLPNVEKISYDCPKMIS